jgi:hypothetical protein
MFGHARMIVSLRTPAQEWRSVGVEPSSRSFQKIERIRLFLKQADRHSTAIFRQRISTVIWRELPLRIQRPRPIFKMQKG